MLQPLLLLLALLCAAAPPDAALTARLRDTVLLNGDEILAGLGLLAAPDPYAPAHHAASAAWWAQRAADPAVCAVDMGEDGRHYRLVTHASAEAAEAAGHTVTHRHACGACSSLQDLAVYLETPDLTSPARACARRVGTTARRACMQAVGFSPPCAEVWAYNAENTREMCLSACLETYGLWGLATGRMHAPNNLPDGRLNPCLACDEAQSGPGFQRAAGRTRRSSGILSEIQREPGEVYTLRHDRYWGRAGTQTETNGERNAAEERL